MLDLSNDHRNELCLALDDRVDYIDNAIRQVDGRIKVMNDVLSGKLESSTLVSVTVMEEARSKLIAHLGTVLECYHLLGCQPSVQASVLMSELNLKKVS
jgi:hypothetical protein